MGPQSRIAMGIGLFLALAVAASDPVASQGRQGEVRRVEAGGEAPSSIEDRTSARCIIEEGLLLDMVPEDERGLFVALVNWILDIVLSQNSDDPAPYEGRRTVVDPMVTEYRIASSRVFDETALAEYRSKAGTGEAYDARVLRPGMMKMLVELRYWDRGGVAWPQEDWQPRTYYFKPLGRGWRMDHAFMSPRTHRSILVESSDSECIGDPRTPICAVDTWLACHIRNNPALCRLATNEESRSIREMPFIWNGRGIEFSVLQINPSDAQADPGAGSPRTYEVILKNSYGPARPEGMPRSEEYIRFVLSRAETGWQITEQEITHWVRPE